MLFWDYVCCTLILQGAVSPRPLEDKVQGTLSLREPGESLCEPTRHPCIYKVRGSVNKTRPIGL